MRANLPVGSSNIQFLDRRIGEVSPGFGIDRQGLTRPVIGFDQQCASEARTTEAQRESPSPSKQLEVVVWADCPSAACLVGCR